MPPLLLSIIVVAHNSAPLIDATLTSILAQLNAQHELVLVNDGSTDTTLAQLHTLQRQHPGVAWQVIDQPAQGVSVARNTGVAAARGAYLAFIDSDDLLLPGALAAICAALEEHRPDVLTCDFNMWHPAHPARNRAVRLSYPSRALITDRDAILATFFFDRHLYVWTKIFKRDIYTAHGMPVFPPGRVFEDVSAVPQLLARCASLFYLPQAIVDYRQHDASITKVINAQWCLDFAAATRALRAALEPLALAEHTRLQFDVTVCYFYLAVVKNSYQLARRSGRPVRQQVRASCIASLFHDYRRVLRAMRGQEIASADRRADQDYARQIGQAFSGAVLFRLRQTVNRKIKLWRRLRAR